MVTQSGPGRGAPAPKDAPPLPFETYGFLTLLPPP